MNARLKLVLLWALGAAFCGVAVFLFLSDTHLLPVFSVFVVILLLVQALGHAPASFMMAAFATLLGVFVMTKLAPEEIVAAPFLILAMWGAGFLLYMRSQKAGARRDLRAAEQDEIRRRIRQREQEIAFYEERQQALAVREGRRNILAQAARELGSLLDPEMVHQRLRTAAQTLFPGRRVDVSVGQQRDVVDALVLERRGPVLLPTPRHPGPAVMAVPVMAQGVVAGVVRVGGDTGPAFERDELRLLEILGSLASLALGNCLLFNAVQGNALRDGLTGLWTHRAFLDQLDAALLEASRFSKPLSVALFDLDHFKAINDGHGHQAGDDILQGFAHVLARNVREVDVVARYGGEEFVVLFLQTGHAEALEAAERIRTDLAEQVFDVPGAGLRATASAGVATFPEDAATPQLLLRRADQWLYEAKRSGRNRVRSARQ